MYCPHKVNVFLGFVGFISTDDISHRPFQLFQLWLFVFIGCRGVLCPAKTCTTRRSLPAFRRLKGSRSLKVNLFPYASSRAVPEEGLKWIWPSKLLLRMFSSVRPVRLAKPCGSCPDRLFSEISMYVGLWVRVITALHLITIKL